ncbi:Zn-dependent protease [Stappia sp. GBMRC 2046]|uniref:Zn-dependent protease n=2 Tax=Stappia sediminis TaxID=2692190 RepID=A0A7X3LTT6_9HYPH|nr:Zn-dependent protease [Stappia sediminis]
MKDASWSWGQKTAPSMEDFVEIAEAAFDGLPEEFRELCGDIQVTVADFADDDVLDSLGIEDPFGLLGLFEGVGLAHGGANSFTGQMPNRVWLYRRPILDYWTSHEDTLAAVIAHVLIHEIGHHFGLSDDDMEAIEASAD